MGKVSVCITIYNEKEETIKKLLSGLEKQTLKPDEIIIVDASASPVFNLQLTRPASLSIFNQFKNLNFQLLHKRGVSRAEGRNIAIKKAKNNIIAITDAGCVPHKDWLQQLTKPFEITTSQASRNDIVVAGSYEMIFKNSFQKAEAVFLGIDLKDISDNFMPSARSMAFTKSIWKKAGGFPENLKNTAEDTLFNLNLINAGAKFVVSKNAIIDWLMPTTIYDFGFKIYGYAKGDAASGIWWHPIKKLKTHNIKVLTVFLRYLILIILLLVNKPLCLVYVLCYMLYGYNKARHWGIILQFVSDFACIIGFSHGILQTSIKRN